MRGTFIFTKTGRLLPSSTSLSIQARWTHITYSNKGRTQLQYNAKTYLVFLLNFYIIIGEGKG